jgi:Mg2+/Co2+ transporter CorB
MLLIVVSVIILLLFLAAMLSATETAITATSPGIIQKMKSEGNKRAGQLLSLLKIKEKVISTLLIGNSFANTLCTIMATSVFIEWLGDDLGTLVSSIVLSLVVIVFSEVVPKAIAVSKAEKIALAATPVLKVFLKILEPVNIFLAYTVKIFCKILRIDLKQQVSAADEVRGVIEHHLHEGNVVKDDRDMLGGILDLRDLTVGDIMVHRSNIVAMNIDTPSEQAIKAVLAASHTRIPFWEETHDNIIGILHTKDLVNAIHNNKNHTIQDIEIRQLLSTPVFIPDNALAIAQLHTFKEGQSHLACVVNEYGDLQGIITLEDILEEIVGQIYDEHDASNDKIIKKSDTEFIVDGSMPIRDLNREFGWMLSEEDATTIAGFVINKLERIPEQGEFFVEKNLKIIIRKKLDNRIKTIRVVVLKESENLDD